MAGPRRIAIPRALRPALGADATAGEPAAVAGASAAGMAAREAGVAWPGACLLAAIGLDLAGGAVASLTRGVRAVHSGMPAIGKLGFLALHAPHPAAAIRAAGASSWGWAGALFAHAFASAAAPLLVRSRERAAAGMGLALAGILLLPLLLPAPPGLGWLPAAYLLKLVLAFAAPGRPA